MDFVVVGFGIGALAVLIGLTLHDLGSTWHRLRPNLLYPPLEVARCIAWGRGCRALGRVLALAGVTLCLFTLLALVVQLSDRAGAVTIMITLTLVLVGVLTWAALYAHRYHPRPLPRRPGRPTAVDLPAPDPAAMAGNGAWDRDPFLTPIDPSLLARDAPGIDPADSLATIAGEREADLLRIDDGPSGPGSNANEAAASQTNDHDDAATSLRADHPPEPEPMAAAATNQRPAEPELDDVTSAPTNGSPVADVPPTDWQDPAQARPAVAPASDETPSLTPAGKAR